MQQRTSRTPTHCPVALASRGRSITPVQPLTLFAAIYSLLARAASVHCLFSAALVAERAQVAGATGCTDRSILNHYPPPLTPQSTDGATDVRLVERERERARNVGAMLLAAGATLLNSRCCYRGINWHKQPPKQKIQYFEIQSSCLHDLSGTQCEWRTQGSS